MKNRLRLKGDNQDIEIGFSEVDIVPTSADEVIRLKSGLTNVTFNVGDNDQLILGKDISEYDITSPGGNTVQIQDGGGNAVQINVGGSGKLGFKNKRGNVNINPGTGKPNFETIEVPSTPFNTSGVTLEDIPDNRTQITKNHSDIVSENTTQSSPFDVSDENKCYTLICDANQNNSFYIDGFSEKDVLRFINSPTASDGDLNVSNSDYANGQVQFTVGDVDVYLSSLACAAIWDATSFKSMLGDSSLIIE